MCVDALKQVEEKQNSRIHNKVVSVGMTEVVCDEPSTIPDRWSMRTSLEVRQSRTTAVDYVEMVL